MPWHAVADGEGFVGVSATDSYLPGDLLHLLSEGNATLADASERLCAREACIDTNAIRIMPPMMPE